MEARYNDALILDVMRRGGEVDEVPQDNTSMIVKHLTQEVTVVSRVKYEIFVLHVLVQSEELFNQFVRGGKDSYGIVRI